VALFAKVLQDARLLHLSLELLERPIEAICFVEYYFDHTMLGKEVVVQLPLK
jgi:hypothetical protein